MEFNSNYNTLYKNNLIKLFLKKLQHSGKYTKSEKIFQNLLIELKLKSNIDPLILIEKTILNLAPPIILKKKKIGSTVYLIPTPIHLKKAVSIGILWLLKYVKNTQDLANEIINIVNLQGNVWNKKQQYINTAILNRVFSHISILNYSRYIKSNNKYLYYIDKYIEELINNK
nr:ribosomal protein S7 [Coccidia sp. AB-2023a]